MEILEHGIYYNECNETTCSCGCKFRYETSDICVDNTLALTSNPPLYNRFIICPECGSKIYLNTFTHSKTFSAGNTYFYKELGNSIAKVYKNTNDSGKIIDSKSVNGTELN